MSHAQTMEFRTELKQLLDIIIHSLYSEREIFLRELVSNACDAIDKLRFESLSRPELLENDETWEIRLFPDAEARTLTISDNGIGMSPETIVENLGTIARSGTQEFLHALKEADAEQRPALIGQFGVGFYSAFMVADRVVVVSRMAGDDRAVRWSSTGEGEFTVEDAERSARGTDVILHLKEDASEFLEEYRLRGIVKRYSDFVEHPIQMRVERTEGEGDERKTETVDETLNSRKALWLRAPTDIALGDYHEFYKQIAHDFRDPAKIIHFSAEGTLEFRALLYLPEERPLDFFWGEPQAGLQLYIQRVFIMDRCEDLLPMYLRFVKGVVDSSDLPLNVSREMLQKNKVVTQIRKAIVNKVLRSLEEMKRDERKSYEVFFRQFGAVLKEGISHDPANREQIAKLLLFGSTRTEKDELIGLEEYVERMPEGQEAIWVLTGERRELLKRSPYVEALAAQGQEVLLLTDPVDELLIDALGDFEDKSIRAVDRGELPASEDEIDVETRESFESLLSYLKISLGKIKDVRLSTRLKESAACLVGDEGMVSAHMERLLERMGRGGELPRRERILELNPIHPVVVALRELYARDPGDDRLEDFGRLLYDQAVLAEGSPLEDPAAMAQRINMLIESAAKD